MGNVKDKEEVWRDYNSQTLRQYTTSIIINVTSVPVAHHTLWLVICIQFLEQQLKFHSLPLLHSRKQIRMQVEKMNL